MGIVYFTRHGQTVWNVERKSCGATDVELTPLGYEQARELGEHIKAEGIQIDEILYSPLIRAANTAKTISHEYIKERPQYCQNYRTFLSVSSR